MVTSVEEGRGLKAYRNVYSWYQAMHQTSVHKLRCKGMNPRPADKASEVAERLESWVGDAMRLKRIGRVTEQLPEP